MRMACRHNFDVCDDIERESELAIHIKNAKRQEGWTTMALGIMDEMPEVGCLKYTIHTNVDGKHKIVLTFMEDYIK